MQGLEVAEKELRDIMEKARPLWGFVKTTLTQSIRYIGCDFTVNLNEIDKPVTLEELLSTMDVGMSQYFLESKLINGTY